MNVLIPPELYEMIKSLAESQGLTEVEALKRAVSINAYFDNAIKDGNKLLMLKVDGDVREVVLTGLPSKLK